LKTSCFFLASAMLGDCEQIQIQKKKDKETDADAVGRWLAVRWNSVETQSRRRARQRGTGLWQLQLTIWHMSTGWYKGECAQHAMNGLDRCGSIDKVCM
jgi:hypothetical protein